MRFYCSECAKPFNFDPDCQEKQILCPVCGKQFEKPADIGSGIVIGDFLIEKLLSRGGMGEVFLARQLSLDRPVALKVLQKKFTGDQEYVDSLIREARAAAKINHPNIVQAYMVGEEEGIYYFAMEYIRGETFKKILKEKGVLDFVKAAKVIRDVAGALDVAWREQKLVHQDIKPDNIMIDVNGFTKLADLGLAKTAGTDNGDEDADEVLGTPQYISPEQLTGVPTDVRSDLYSLGATFYHFVTGRFAYEADTAEEITKMHVAGNLTPPQKVNPELPDALNAIIVKMMARKIEERYQEPGSLIRDLENFLHNAEKIAGKGAKISPLKIVVPPQGGTAKDAAPKLNIVKPGGPKLPAVKPATPAAPAVPKPAAPALKPVVSKPAAPALKPVVSKSAAPALKFGVPKPAAAPAAPAASKSEEIKPEKSGEKGKPEAAAAELPKKKKTADPAKRRFMIRLCCWMGLVLIVLLFAAAVTGCILERKSKLPPELQPPFRAVNQAVNRMLGAARDKALEMSKPEDFSESADKKKPVIVTRPEYIEMVDGVIVWHNANPEKKRELIAKIDALWPQAVAAVTAEERNKLEHLAGIFSASDEELRCRDAREKMIRTHRDRLDAIDAKLQAEAEKRKQAEIERKKAQEENQEKARKMAEQRVAEEQERSRLLQVEGRKIDGIMESVAEAMASALSSDQEAVLQKAVAGAKEFRLPSAASGGGIQQKLARLHRFGEDSLKKFQAVRAYRLRLAQIDENSNIRVMFARRSATVISIKNGEIWCREKDKKPFRLKLTGELPRTRASLYKALRSRKFDHPAFYLGLFAGEMDSIAVKDIPGGYWKENWSLLKKYIH